MSDEKTRAETAEVTPRTVVVFRDASVTHLDALYEIAIPGRHSREEAIRRAEWGFVDQLNSQPRMLHPTGKLVFDSIRYDEGTP